jgi:hypothetical protein
VTLAYRHGAQPSQVAQLSEQDLAALKDSYRNLDDLDPRTVQQAQAGFRHAYAIAQRVVDGSIDPLSA